MIKSMLTVLLASSLLFVSCMKDKDNNGGSDIQAAGLMAFNLAPQQPAVNFALSGSALTNVPLAYTNYTGNYLGIYPGTRTFDAYNAYGTGIIAGSSAEFVAGKYYSGFLIGADSSYRTVVVSDELDSLPGSSGQAFVRYINAIPDSSVVPTISIAAGGSNVLTAPARYGSVSAFTAVPPGDIAVNLSNQGNINTSRTIQVEARKIYTLLLVGRPAVADAPVGIRFITNGTLSADSTGSGSGRSTSASGRSISVN